MAYKLGWTAPLCGHRALSLVDQAVHTRFLESDNVGQDVEPIEFAVVDKEALALGRDFPRNTVGWPVMTRRMLSSLLSVGEFPHRAYAVELAGQTQGDYVLCRLAEKVDGIDWLKSDWEATGREIAGRHRGMLSRLVLRDQRFPPFFELKGLPFLFVSDAGRKALARDKIVGVEFRELAQVVGGVTLPDAERSLAAP